MYPLALLLTVPLVISTAAVTLWAGWQLARIVSRAGDSLALGLDFHGLWVLGLAVGAVLWKFTAPALAIEAWPTQRISAAIYALIWIGFVMASAVLVVTAVAMQLLGVTSLTDPRLLLFISWPVLDAAASLLPAALKTPAAWRRAQATKTSDTSSAPAPNVICALEHRSTSPSHPIKDGLFRLLQDLAQQPHGDVLVGVHIARDGMILTSQGTLARLQHVSKSTINRSLLALRAEGRILFNASARETRITIVNHDDSSCPERSGTNGATA